MENLYFVTVYAVYNDGKSAKKAIYDARDKNDAVNQFHRNLSTYGEDPTCRIALVQIQDILNTYNRSETTLPKEAPVKEE